MDNPNISTKIRLSRHFLQVGADILGIEARASVTSLLESFRSNFKYGPARCAFLFIQTRQLPLIPNGYQPKHLLWTLYFLLTYATERRLCCVLRTDRKTIRKYTWPIISAIASLAPTLVCHSKNFRLNVTKFQDSQRAFVF